MNIRMNKIVGILSTLTLAGMVFAQDPVAPAENAAAPVEQAAPVAEAPAAAPEAAPVEEAVAPAEESAPVAVRGAEEVPAPVEEPVITEAPRAVRGAASTGPAEDPVQKFRDAKNTVYYEKVYTNEGAPVRTVYVAQRNEKDSVTMEQLLGLVPMEFKVGAHGTIGSYYMSTNEWDGDQYDGMNWKLGLMSILPLSEYTMGIKVGVLYEQSEASQSYYVNGLPCTFKFKQKKIDVPVLFTFKAPTSRIYFDLGAQLSIPLYDKLKYTSTDASGKKSSNRIDMIDEDYRNSIDWAFVFGFSVMVHKHISLDVGADVGLSNIYSGHMKYVDLDMSSASFNIGLTLYPF